jgi:hypothetical protein
MTDALFCSYGAPFFAVKNTSGYWRLIQGCCNHWDCPRCGEMRAKQEYGRIVEGCRTLVKQGHKLYFVTVTCRGMELSVKDAVDNYLKWTSKLLDAAYSKAKREGMHWTYVQVTELQERGHPHSHILTTWHPDDEIEGTKRTYGMHEGVYQWHDKDVLRSEWLAGQVIKSGLGKEYDISEVDSVEGASRYVAKYLFHEEMFNYKFPKPWKRVRYAQSFPKLPERKNDEVIPLVTTNQWSDFLDTVDDVMVKEEDKEAVLKKMRFVDKFVSIIVRD